MAKSPMGYMVRAWKKERKDPVWGMGSRKQRNACRRHNSRVTRVSGNSANLDTMIRSIGVKLITCEDMEELKRLSEEEPDG